MARTKPFVKVHLAVADHPKSAEAWSSLELRGMLVELWRKAGEKYAAKRDDRVQLKPTDRMEIACTTDIEAADEAVARLCKAMKYTVRKYANRWEVHVRKFAKKQGFESPDLDDNSTTSRKHLDRFLGAETPRLRNTETPNAEGRGSEGGTAEDPSPDPAPAGARSPAGAPTPRSVLIRKPETFPPDSMTRLAAWGERVGLTRSHLNAALERFREWSPAEAPFERPIEAWESSFQKIAKDPELKPAKAPKARAAYRRDESGQVLVPNEWRGLGS